jgi:hypothetical protein
MVVAWLVVSLFFMVTFSVLLVPALGGIGLFYAWLATNIAVAVLGLLLSLQDGA